MFGILDQFLESQDLKHLRLFPMGYICNHACPMCWREHISPEVRLDMTRAAFTTDLQLDDYLKILTTMPDSVEKISLCGGGEPTLFPKIRELMTQIKKKKKYGHMITNGSMLTPDFVDFLIDIGWNSLHISVNASSRKVFDVINGVDHFDLVIGNIKNVIKKRGKGTFPKVRLSFVIQKGNLHELVPFAQLAMKLGANDINFGTLIPHDLTLHTPSPFALDAKERLQAIEYLQEIERITKVHPIQTNIRFVLPIYMGHPSYSDRPDPQYWQKRYCDRVQHTMDIMSTGEVLPCGFGFQLKESFSLNMNIKRGKVEDFWHSKEYTRFRRRLRRGDFYPACRKYCNFFLAYK